MANNARYKIFDASLNNNQGGWVEYHFKTNAAQVDQTTGTGWRKWMSASVTVNGVAFAENGSGASATINASNINWYGGTKPSTNYLGSATNIQAALTALDTAAKNAYDNIPSGILTQDNFNTYYPNLDNIEDLSGTGLLKKSGTNWSLDTNTYLTASTGVTSVTGHTGAVTAAQLKSDLGLGDAAYKGVASSVTQNGTGLVTAGAVWSAIDALPEAMVFKGTVGDSATVSWTNLSAAATANEGWTYKVVTAHSADTKCPAAKVGDTITSNGSAWVVIPSGDDVEDTWRIIQVNGTQLKGSGTSTGLINFVNGGNITVTGSGNNITLGVASGYSIPSTTKQSAWDAKYSKPSGGIPGSDLAVAYLPLAGTTALTGSIVPTNANAVDLGSGTKPFKEICGQKIFARNTSDSSWASFEADEDDGLTIKVYDGDENTKTYYLGTGNGSAETIATRTWVSNNTPKIVVLAGDTAPTGTFKTGDIWIN